MTIEVAIAAVGLGRRLRADPRVVAIFVAFEIAHDIIANILPLPLTVAAAARGLSGLYCVVRRLGELCLSVQVTRAFALAGTFVPVPTKKVLPSTSLASNASHTTDGRCRRAQADNSDAFHSTTTFVSPIFISILLGVSITRELAVKYRTVALGLVDEVVALLRDTDSGSRVHQQLPRRRRCQFRDE